MTALCGEHEHREHVDTEGYSLSCPQERMKGTEYFSAVFLDYVFISPLQRKIWRIISWGLLLTLVMNMRSTYNVIKIFNIKRHPNLEVIDYFMSPHLNTLFE